MDHQRIEDLRRRVEKDPASIAFAQLAEEYRRIGDFHQAARVCRAGLAVHPGYLSARVTLGRTLIELGQLDEAEDELQIVLKSAPENLSARRGLAEIHHRRGSLEDALTHFEAALGVARNDPELEQTVADLRRKVAPAVAKPLLSFSHAPGVVAPPSPAAVLQEEDFAVPSSSHPARTADPVRENALRTVAALEEWLNAIHASRPEQRA